jgi:DNA sulfur modification protein DndB
MSDITLLPAIRSRVGDWMFYSASISFLNVKKLIKSPDEIHERKGLADWIQREAIDTHADAIADYIKNNDQRFLGALVIGIYDGDPNWIPLNVNFSSDLVDVPEELRNHITGKLGLLKLSGAEKLFAIDGQHRVAGIKKALESEVENISGSDEEVTAIFVSHNGSTDEGKQRTRRLFTTLNKKAKRISKAAEIALDEDNGFAIVTRMLIDSHWLFEDERGHISYTSSGAIKAEDTNTITSVVGLHEIIKDLFVDVKKVFESSRPTDTQLEHHLSICKDFLDYLLENSECFKNVFVDKSQSASFYRIEENHLLFRPIGQRAFAKAVLVLMNRGNNMENAINTLLQANLDISSNDWHNILWDPVDSTMIVNKVAIAESQLLTLTGNEPQNNRKKNSLEELIDSRGY